MTVDDEKKFLEYVLTRSMHNEDEVTEIAEGLGNERVIVLLTNVTAQLLDHRYPNTHPTREEISDYAKLLATEYTSDEINISPLTIEGIIRVQYGETDLAQGMNVAELIPHQMLIAHDIFRRLDLGEAELRQIVQHAMTDD